MITTLLNSACAIQMKFALIDNTNNGLLGFCADSATCIILQRTMVDTVMRAYAPWHAQYDDLNRKFLEQEWFLSKQTWMFEPLLPGARNALYDKRRSLFGLRMPLARRLTRMLADATLNASASVWPYIENNIELALRECDPSLGVYGPSIIEYAQINEIEPSAAYREIKLKNDTAQSIKIRMFAWSERFTLALSSVNTDEDAAEFLRTLQAKFSKDSSL